jgi:hypothetical protein
MESIDARQITARRFLHCRCSAGYVSTKKDGTERLNFTAFYEALLEARASGRAAKAAVSLAAASAT